MASGLYLQQGRGWRAGAARVGINCTIVLLALTEIELASKLVGALEGHAMRFVGQAGPA